MKTTKGIPLKLYSANMQDLKKYIYNNNIKGILPNCIFSKAAAHSFDGMLNGLDDIYKFKL